jgi:hypothetical protein
MKQTTLKKEEERTHNSSYTQAGVSFFYESEVLNQSSVLRRKFRAKNPHLRVAAKRCSEIPSGFRYIARRLCRPKPFQGLRTSEGFAKCKTLRKASGR